MSMLAQDIRKMSVEEMRDKVLELKKSLFEFRTQLQTGKLEKNGEIEVVKRDVARILTIIREEELKVSQSKESANK